MVSSPRFASRPLERHCIFCGRDPATRSREHVLPQWLIRHTGDPKRKVVLGINYSENRPIRSFAFDQFTFPACGSCNNTFSRLESQSKPIIEALADREPVSEHQLDTLMDWLDKVRVGLWLGGRFLSNNFADIDPNFHISDRIARSDRALFITHTDAGRGLTITGTMSLMFASMPSVFGIRINGTLLLSKSTDLMISRDLGFPYAMKRWQTEGEEIALEMEQGLNATGPITLGQRYRLPAVRVFQPLYRKHLHGTVDLHRSPYVASHSLDPLHGRGRVYVVTDAGTRWGGIRSQDHLSGELVVPLDLASQFGAATLEAQNELVWTIPSERRLPPSKRGRGYRFHFAYAMNERAIQAHLEGRIARSFAEIEDINSKFEASLSRATPRAR